MKRKEDVGSEHRRKRLWYTVNSYPRPKPGNRPCDKLRPRWYGPFEVLEISPNALRLELPHQLKCHPVFNVCCLEKNTMKSSQIDGRYTSPPPLITDLDGFERYIVQEVIAHRRLHRGFTTFSEMGWVSGRHMGAREFSQERRWRRSDALV